jgi:uncharacterized membrane protein
MKRWLIVSTVFTLLAFAGGLGVYFGLFGQLPEQVPTHWNIRNEPDSWVPREKILPYLLLTPAMMVGFMLLTAILPWLSPKHFKVDPFRSTYYYVMTLVIVLFCFIQGIVLSSTLGWGWPMGKLLMAGLFLFFALLGNVLGQVRRNFWMGVRTPWTLASDTVWIQTHRMAAWLFVIGGILGCVLVLAVPGDMIVLWCLPLFLLIVLAPVLYSLVLYKRLEKEGRL